MRTRSALPATLGGAVLVVAIAAPVSAHVTVHSVEAFQGATDAEIVFRVPDEEDKANTVKVEFDLPLDTPIIGVAVAPPPGWTATATQAKLPKPVHTDDGDETSAVSRIVFSGGKITPGDYVDFPISADLLPTAPQLVFKAIQTYSNGHVVRWIEQSAPGAQEPEHPAPILTLRPAGAVATPVPTPSPPVAIAPVPAQPSADTAALQSLTSQLADKAGKKRTNLALGLAIAALVVGLIGGAAGASAVRRRR